MLQRVRKSSFSLGFYDVFCPPRGLQEGPRWAQDGPKMAQDGAQMQHESKMP